MKKLITSFTKLVPVFPSLTKGLDGTKTFKELKLLAKAARRFQEQMIDIETVSKTKAEEWNKQNPPLKGEEENFAEKSISRQKSMGDFIEAQKNFHDEELIFELSEEELKRRLFSKSVGVPRRYANPKRLVGQWLKAVH